MSVRARHSLALLVLAAIWLAMLLFGGGSLDHRIYEALYIGHDPVIVPAAEVITNIGRPTILVIAGVLIGVWLWFRSRARVALAIVSIILVGRGLSVVQKYFVARARPTLEPHLVVVKTSSFPSGHASNAMIVCLTVALALAGNSRWRHLAAAAALLIALTIGMTRVMLGVHWPSDVIGGWSFGALWVLLTLRPAERLFRTDGPRAPAISNVEAE